MERLSRNEVASAVDFAGGRRAQPGERVPGGDHWARMADRQLDGATALYNRLADRRIAWLSDEVGMGKTFIALAVAALVRRQQPDARILFLLPSSRLQPKWEMERLRFSRGLWRPEDHVVRDDHGRPVRPLVKPSNLKDLAAEMVIDPDRDVLAALSAFSMPLSSRDQQKSWRSAWQDLATLSGHLPRKLPADVYRDKGLFKRVFAAALNLLLPTFDLVVCDESHNLRRGALHGAARNQTVAAALGGRRSDDAPLPWRAPPQERVTRLLCLTATPVETDFAEMARQAEVFGFHPDRADLPPAVRADLAALAQTDQSGDTRKDVARRFVVRRIQELHPTTGAEGKTKNQYRREWRAGGLVTHDEPLATPSARERLMVALVQKRVLQTLHQAGAQPDGTFLPSFQMGMLSSFESFDQTIAGRVDKEKPVYDGEEQTHDVNERKGVDSRAVDAICASYRERFGTAPPHPKMNQVAASLAERALAGEKSLVFVRRVRTTEELAAKVAEHMDDALIRHVRERAPASLHPALDANVGAYRAQRRRADAPRPVATDDDAREDEGGADTWFAWCFRGTGREDHQLGSGLRQRVFQRPAHPWSFFFYDNHVLWLFDDDPDALRHWATAHGEALERGARRWLPQVEKPGHRHRYEAWQAAALERLSQQSPDGPRAKLAGRVLDALYTQRKTPFEGPIGTTDRILLEPFFVRLRRSSLCDTLWPSGADHPSPEGDALVDRERRRELLASTMRLGRSFVDLWLCAVQLADGLDVPAPFATDHLAELGDRMLQLLDAQSRGPRRQNAWHELSQVAEHHELLLELNFPDVSDRWTDWTAYFGNALSTQSPVLGMHGGSRSERAMTQFRMPGYPMVLVATDVLQEGVDLHTFCARVVHYGIAHTSSATEQRTGRVDRIGGLVHRRFGPDDDSKLQVHYPHLRDTIEPLQLRVLYERMDRFLRLVHDGLGSVDQESSRIELDRSIHGEQAYPEPPSERLKTAFDVQPADHEGTGTLRAVGALFSDHTVILEALRSLVPGTAYHEQRGLWHGEAWVEGDDVVDEEAPGARRQPFTAELRTARAGGRRLLRVVSPIGVVDLSDGRTAGKVLRLAGTCSPGVRIRAASRHGLLRSAPNRQPLLEVCVDVEMQCAEGAPDRVRDALQRAVTHADYYEVELLGAEHDLPSGEWTL